MDLDLPLFFLAAPPESQSHALRNIKNTKSLYDLMQCAMEFSDLYARNATTTNAKVRNKLLKLTCIVT